MVLLRVCALIVALACAWPAQAQSTRRESLEQQRATRSKSLTTYEPGKVEKALLYLERERIVERLFGGEGWYPVIGSLQRGGGFAVGAGYRRHFANRALLFDTTAVYSFKGYRLLKGEFGPDRLLGDRLRVTALARYRYFPQEDYFGLGPRSLKANRTNYLFEETEFGGQAVLQPLPWLRWTNKVSLLNPRIGAGTDTLQPSIETIFVEATAPGLDRQPNFLETSTLIELDGRDQPGNPRAGTYGALLVSRYRDRDDLGYDSSRVAGEVQQYFPIFDKKRVIVFRGAFNHHDPAAGSRVPFYYLASLGGKDSIRGFNDFRFRDLNAMLFNAEYRWEAFAGLDMALFYDLGDVKPQWSELSWSDLKRSWGIGFRFNTYQAIFMRTEIAFNSGEGTRFFVAFGGPLRLERYIR